MPVSILLITHNGVGTALLETVTKTFGTLPTIVRAVSIDYDVNPDTLLPQLRMIANSMDFGDGVLVLTDMLGATPSNLAQALQDEEQILVLAGLNLPMLMRAVNYACLDLMEVAQKALSGGRDGVCDCEARKANHA